MAERKTRGIAAFTAAADQTGKEGYCVTLSASGVAVATGATDAVVGGVRDGGDSGKKSEGAMSGPFRSEDGAVGRGGSTRWCP